MTAALFLLDLDCSFETSLKIDYSVSCLYATKIKMWTSYYQYAYSLPHYNVIIKISLLKFEYFVPIYAI